AGSVWQVGEMLRPHEGGGVRVLLGDGTVLEADGPASLVRESAADGERERIRLREGTVSIRARHGARPLVIAVPQGWVRVIGTVLVVSLHEGPAAGGDASPPAFCVIEVLEGTVQIEGSGVETRSIEMRSVETLPAGTRGILAASGPPMRQEIPASAPDAAQRTRLEDEARACLARGDERGAVLLLAAARHRMTGGAQAAPGVAE
ncbi:MAG: FecR domain-containing protein, partial [Planctomycetes bacterium]|nr:FecR domain-containing protein [Planctomycetota bacterium]